MWIRKFEGNNSLKFQFQLQQRIEQWKTVNFTDIISVDTIDPTTNMSNGFGPATIQDFVAEYDADRNRFWVIVDYANYTLEKEWLSFTLDPYSHNAYPAFSPPNNVEFNPAFIGLYLSVVANNNQNANAYSAQEYALYSVSVVVTYVVTGLALFAVLTSLAFRAGKVIVFEMIAIMQLNYFALAFLDSMNPVFSGLLPLRFLAGILTFQNVEQYL